MAEYADVLAACQSLGLELDALTVDGNWHRCRVQRNKSNRDGAYCLRELCLRSGTRVLVGVAHNWHSGEQITFDIDQAINSLSEDEKRAAREAWQQSQKQAETARKEVEANTAKRAQQLWERASEVGACAYLDAKKVRGYGVKFMRGNLLVPVRHLHTLALVGLQFIGADGAKKFLTGTPKKGCAHVLGDWPGDVPRPILICEGYATGATLHAATQHTVVVAFDAGNILPVGEALRTLFPQHPIVICGDDDAQTEGNPGRTKATIAAAVVAGVAVFPNFMDVAV